MKALGRDFTKCMRIFFPKASLCHMGFSLVFASRSVFVNLLRNRRLSFQKRRRSRRRRKCRRKRSGEGEQGRRGRRRRRRRQEDENDFFLPQLLPFFFSLSSIQTLGPFFFGTWRRGRRRRRSHGSCLTHSLAFPARFSPSLLSFPLFSSD